MLNLLGSNFGGKGAVSRASEDNGLDLGVGLKLPDRLIHLAVEVPAKRVKHFWPIEGDYTYPFVFLYYDILVTQRNTPTKIIGVIILVGVE